MDIPRISTGWASGDEVVICRKILGPRVNFTVIGPRLILRRSLAKNRMRSADLIRHAGIWKTWRFWNTLQVWRGLGREDERKEVRYKDASKKEMFKSKLWVHKQFSSEQKVGALCAEDFLSLPTNVCQLQDWVVFLGGGRRHLRDETERGNLGNVLQVEQVEHLHKAIMTMSLLFMYASVMCTLYGSVEETELWTYW